VPFRNPRLPFYQSLCNPEPRVSEGHPYTSDWQQREQQVTCGFCSCEKMGRTLCILDLIVY
jgi:hypothetical protein